MKNASSNTEFPESELIINKDGSVYHLSLKPDQIADTILVVGDPSRVHRISNHFDELEYDVAHREFVSHTGTYNGKRLTVISTGIGTDNVEVALNELDALVNIDFKTRQRKSVHTSLNIIRIGTSGSIRPELPIGTMLLTEYAIGFDALMQFYVLENTDFEKDISKNLQKKLGLHFTPYCVKVSEELRTLFDNGFIKGNTVTSPGFYAPQGRKLRYELRYPQLLKDLTNFEYNAFRISNFEMETAAYYALARILGHQALSLNAIVANRHHQEFGKDTNLIIDALIEKVLQTIAPEDAKKEKDDNLISKVVHAVDYAVDNVVDSTVETVHKVVDQVVDPTMDTMHKVVDSTLDSVQDTVSKIPDVTKKVIGQAGYFNFFRKNKTEDKQENTENQKDKTNDTPSEPTH